MAVRGTSGAWQDGGTFNNPTFTGLRKGVNAILSVSGIAFVKAPTGSMGNNGAITLGTALPKTYAGGCYMWLPAGSIASGVPASASWYWVVMSSTTRGTVYNSTYSSGIPVAGTLTAFVTTGPGAFTGDTGTITAVSVTLPANSLGTGGMFGADIEIANNTTAGNKTYQVLLGGSFIYQQTRTSQGSSVVKARAHNRGATGRQTRSYSESTSSSTGFGTVVAAESTEDTTTDLTISVTIAATSAATDYGILESHEFFYAAL